MHLAMLDMGQRKYGDATVCQVAGKVILVDGAHLGDDRAGASGADWPSIPEQLKSVLGKDGPHDIDLLVVTHCHCDHIGCLPELVQSGLITAKWALLADPRMGFGVPLGAEFPSVPGDTVGRVAAALVEEQLPVDASADEIRALIDAAATLQTRYARMIHRLLENGTRVILYGRDPHDVLEHEFASIGLKILGPAVNQLLICAYRIERERERADQRTSQAALPDSCDEISLYRTLVHSPLPDDEPLPDEGIGAAVNNQSIVLRVGQASDAVLLTGDMQFASLGIGHLGATMGQLHQAIINAGPYAFVKLSHHGAPNGTDEKFLDRIPATSLFGISSGSGDARHPSQSVLDLLASRSGKPIWARTDVNGLVSLRLTKGEPEWALARGELSTQEVVQGGRRASATAATPSADRQAPVVNGDRLAAVPKLMFVTNLAKLRSRVGDQADQAVDRIRQAGHSVVDLIEQIAPHEIAQMARGSHGLVVLGGYNVLSAEPVDALPSALRSRLPKRQRDPDNFVVWSDDPFGDPDLRGLPSIPVSRIPDVPGHGLMLAGLDLCESGQGSFGLRNCNRPFADAVYAKLGSASPILQTEPICTADIEASLVDVGHVYLMLHAASDQLGIYTGERMCPNGTGVTGSIDAFGIENVPPSCGATVFTGCCWGGLIVREMGAHWEAGGLSDLSVTDSIALTFLQAGARAFIGCTGQHYSPPEPPYQSASGPLHHYFWDGIAAGKSPAAALLDAKINYAIEMPYSAGDGAKAVEYKTWRQFTCLGLGW